MGIGNQYTLCKHYLFTNVQICFVVLLHITMARLYDNEANKYFFLKYNKTT